MKKVERQASSFKRTYKGLGSQALEHQSTVHAEQWHSSILLKKSQGGELKVKQRPAHIFIYYNYT